jgi:hypothetical protein
MSAPNPYEVLGVSQNASTAEIAKAFTVAMQQRKYPVDVIASSRKRLMNPRERLIADYLLPIPPSFSSVREFQRTDFSALFEPVQTVEFLSEFDGLEDASASSNEVTEVDKRLGETLSNFFSK